MMLFSYFCEILTSSLLFSLEPGLSPLPRASSLRKTVQHEHNAGKCGECGDSWNQTRPRDNENGGLFGRGIIVRNYTAGQWIDIHVQLTAVHLGHFEIRLCPLSSSTELEEEACFEQNILQFANGLTKYPVTDEEMQEYFLQAKLPQEIKCDHCVVQWHYLTGNSWGLCPNGTEQIGCGEQETFRGCADVAIL
ncbi:hypothetical protein Fcan01_08630 [Folsomia candida]|uniref:Chitin-binding type-4 domain-containing protein n=1 Tax=Folsomia candida TaxID=158441 RepID=A0A226EDU3_FOLCA|nr:hypothetical protein Fcan01_08630 [Folsomia candida]